jgi:hypothetical protein
MRVRVLGWDCNKFMKEFKITSPIGKKKEKKRKRAGCYKLKPKWCMDNPWANQIQKTHHSLSLERTHHLFSYFIIVDEDYIKMAKNS